MTVKKSEEKKAKAPAKKTAKKAPAKKAPAKAAAKKTVKAPAKKALPTDMEVITDAILEGGFCLCFKMEDTGSCIHRQDGLRREE